MDSASKVFVIEHPADSINGYGFAAGKPLLAQMSNTRLAPTPGWVSPRLPNGAQDWDVLASFIGSFATHARGTWLEHIGIVLAPERIANERAWLGWVEAFAHAIARFAPTARIVLLEDAARPRYESLVRYGDAVRTVRADLEIPARATAMVEGASDTRTLEGQLRVLTVRAMQFVSQGRLSEAERLANAIESLGADAQRHVPAIPVRFAIANALTAAHQHNEAVRSYRAAESAAERAAASGDPQGLWLRITARFGVGAGLLAAPHGARHAAEYYNATVPLCVQLGDAHLELEAHRCASLAHELDRDPRGAWDAGVRALAVVDRLTPDQRENAMLVPLTDALLRVASSRSIGIPRRAIEAELRKRGLRGSEWV